VKSRDAYGVDKDLIRVLESLVSFDKTETLVEVGCGTGTLTMWFAKRLSETGKVVGLDVDGPTLRRSSREAQRGGLRNMVLEVGNAYSLPLPDEYAEIVACKSLLCVLERVEAAVKEMYRVLKRGGQLVAIEPASVQSFYDPEDQRYTRLSEILNQSFRNGWKTVGADQDIGLRLPSLFLKVGLKEIAAEGIVEVHLLSDFRRSDDEVLQQLRTETSRFDEATIKLLAEGGISRGELAEFNQIAAERFRRYSIDLAKARESGYIRVMSPTIIVVGRKL